MNCFNHPDVPAVGICKACQKGLCMECAVDLGHGIACKSHQEEVEMLNYFQLSILAPFFFIGLGIVLNLIGCFTILFESYMDANGTGIMGLGMIFLSLFFLFFGFVLQRHQSKQPKTIIYQQRIKHGTRN